MLTIYDCFFPQISLYFFKSVLQIFVSLIAALWDTFFIQIFLPNIEALSEDAQLNLAKEESLKCINMEKIYQKVNNFTMKKGMENSLVDYKKEKYIEEIEEILIQKIMLKSLEDQKEKKVSRRMSWVR